MEPLKVKFFISKDKRRIYIEDIVSDDIMNTATSVFQVKDLYCKEKGYNPKDISYWVMGDEDEED